MMIPKRKRLLITGASGLLGSNALLALRESYNLIGIFFEHPIAVEGVETLRADVTDEATIASLLARLKPDVVLHAAALIDIDRCEQDKNLALKLNTAAAETVARCAQENGAKMIHISTDAFFSGGKAPYTEMALPCPLNYYGETKWLAEQAVRRNCENHLILRTNIYGRNYQPKLSLSEWMHRELSEGRCIRLFDDVVYTPILVNALARGIDHLIRIDARGTFHYGCDRPLSKWEFGVQLCREFELDESLIIRSSVEGSALKAPRSRYIALDSSKLHALGPQFRHAVEEGLSEFHGLLKPN